MNNLNQAKIKKHSFAAHCFDFWFAASRFSIACLSHILVNYSINIIYFVSFLNYFI